MRPSRLLFLMFTVAACGPDAMPTVPPDMAIAPDLAHDPNGNGGWVLQFSTESFTQVSHGPFWRPGDMLGPCLWEAVIRPSAKSAGTNWLTDGYGGAHSFLGQCQPSNDDKAVCHIAGNILSTTAAPQSFEGFDGAYAGEWAHVAVYYDGGAWVYTYIDGVPTGRTPFAGKRVAPGTGSGAQWLLVGGADHQNFDGEIEWVRGWETAIPDVIVQSPLNAWPPDEVPTSGTYTSDPNLEVFPVFAAMYTQGSGILVPDLSGGYLGHTHAGELNSSTAGGDNLGDTGGSGWSGPGPTWTWEQSAPMGNHLPPEAQGLQADAAPPSPAPPKALVWDSFSRPNSTRWINHTPSLGSSESGTLGPRPWKTANASGFKEARWGIVNERAAYLDNADGFAWVDAGKTDMTVRADRNLSGAVTDEAICKNGGATEGMCANTGLVFRVVDGKNFCWVYTYTANQYAPTVHIGCVINGAEHFHTKDLNAPSDAWRTLQVSAKGTHAEVSVCYSNLSCTDIGGGDGFTDNAKGTGAGIYTPPLMDGRRRWDNFEVCNAGGC